MASLSLNLKTLMSLSKINASELARRTGIAQPIIHRLSTGQNVNPKLATIKPIARYFNVTVSQLIGEDDLPMETQAATTSLKTSHNWNQVPLISWKDAIKWPETMSQIQSSSEVTYISTDAPVSKMAYSLVIKGKAATPQFPEGTTIIVEPKRKPNHQDFVLIHVPGEEEARLQQVIVDGDRHYLKTFDPANNETKIVNLDHAGQFLGVMAQAKVNF